MLKLAVVVALAFLLAGCGPTGAAPASPHVGSTPASACYDPEADGDCHPH